MLFRQIIIFSLVLSILHFNQVNIISVNATQTDSEISQMPFNSSNFIIEIIETLETEAVYKDGKLLGWPFRAEGPFENSERKYRGYNVGMAGIGDFLLSAYNHGYNSSRPLLDEIIQHFIDNAEDSLTGGKFWGRFSDEATAGWTGLRYGNAGIIKFLSRLLKLNYASGLEDLIEEGFKYLKSLQLEDNSWPMTEDGYITTDSQYGAVGIGFSFLELYENLDNNTYLQEAIDIGNYLISNGVWEEDRFLITWTTQAIGSEFDGLIVYGKSAGLAGILDYFNELFLITDNSDFLAVSIGLSKSILYADLGGYWPDGSVSYVSRIYTSNIALTGYDVGSIGIADSLLKLNDYSPDSDLIKAAARAEKFVLSLLDADFSLPVGLAYQSNKITGKSLGTAGLALHQLQLFERYGIDRHEELAINILEHLYNLFTPNLGIPLDETDDTFGFSFNLEDGIAGIGDILLYLETAISGVGGDEYEKVYLNERPNLSLPDVNSTESTTDKSSFYPIFLNILIIYTYQYVSKKSVKHK